MEAIIEEKKKNFNSYTFGEVKTGIGQLVSFSCRSEDIESTKKFIEENIRNIYVPETKFLQSVQHGSYGAPTRFEMIQHKYAGGGSGFIEVLEIKNPPDGRWGFVLYERLDAHHKSFSEWETIDDAKNTFKKHWGSSDSNEKYKKLKGFKRIVNCGLMTPWFYAIGDEALVGDYAFPDGLQDDPVFRFGKKFVVSSGYGDSKKMEIKTCMGTRIITEHEEGAHGRKNCPERVVYWHDGSCWTNSFLNSDDRPRELENGELWISDAAEEFKSLLSGKKKEFSINFSDGIKFVGKIVPEKGKKIYSEGSYYAVVSFKDGTSKEGTLSFKPTAEIPDVISFIKKKFEAVGMAVEKIEIKSSKTEKGGKKWGGVFYNS